MKLRASALLLPGQHTALIRKRCQAMARINQLDLIRMKPSGKAQCRHRMACNHNILLPACRYTSSLRCTMHPMVKHLIRSFPLPCHSSIPILSNTCRCQRSSKISMACLCRKLALVYLRTPHHQISPYHKQSPLRGSWTETLSQLRIQQQTFSCKLLLWLLRQEACIVLLICKRWTILLGQTVP